MSLTDLPDAEHRERIEQLIARTPRPITRAEIVFALLGSDPDMHLRRAARLAETALAPEGTSAC